MTVYMFIDSQCPLCVAEVQMLQRHDKHKHLVFEDIHAPDFNDRYPQFNVHECYNTLHAIDDNGTVVKGLDATVLVWRTVDKHKWLGVLRWPVIKLVADCGYRMFARHRGFFSRLFLGTAKCEVCKDESK